MPYRTAYIAGVGLSSSNPSKSAPGVSKNAYGLAISAGTKALLDAGLGYEDVEHSIGSGLAAGSTSMVAVCRSFGITGRPISEVDESSALYIGSSLIKAGRAECILMIGYEKKTDKLPEGAGGVVLVSEPFLNSHPYLKNSSIAIRAMDQTDRLAVRYAQSSTQKIMKKRMTHLLDRQIDQSLKDVEGLALFEVSLNGVAAVLDFPQQQLRDAKSEQPSDPSSLYRAVWTLRGWQQNRSGGEIKQCLVVFQERNEMTTVCLLSRFDNKPAPRPKEVGQLNDGRGRLGYNPAQESKEISMEDFEAVRARKELRDERLAEKLPFKRKGGDRAALARL